MTVRSLTCILLGFAMTCVVAPNVRAADEAKAPTTAPSAADVAAAKLLNSLAPLIGGEWRINATWAAGNALEARAIYDWGIGKKFVNAKTFVGTKDTEYQRYETIFGVEDGKLKAWQFTFDGHVTAMDFAVEGKKFSSSREMKSPAGQSQGVLHQSIELVEPNKLHWIVQIEQAGQIKPLMDGYWVREASASR